MSATTVTVELTRAQLSLINLSLSYRAGPHPCDGPGRVVAWSTFEVILEALAPPTTQTCNAAVASCDAPTARCES